MIMIKLLRRGSDHDFGTWAFAAVPRPGDLIGITINDVASTLKVEQVVHVPAIFATDPRSKPTPPSIAVIVDIFDARSE